MERNDKLGIMACLIALVLVMALGVGHVVSADCGQYDISEGEDSGTRYEGSGIFLSDGLWHEIGGGYGGSLSNLHRTYDPDTDEWSDSTYGISYSNMRENDICTNEDRTNMAMWGGINLPTSVFRWNSVTDGWTAYTVLPTSPSDAIVFYTRDDNMVHVIWNNGGAIADYWHDFDNTSGNWDTDGTHSGVMSTTARDYGEPVYLEGVNYFFPYNWTSVNSLEYDELTDSFSTVDLSAVTGNPTSAREYLLGAFVQNGHIYILFGDSETSAELDSVELYRYYPTASTMVMVKDDFDNTAGATNVERGSVAWDSGYDDENQIFFNGVGRQGGANEEMYMICMDFLAPIRRVATECYVNAAIDDIGPTCCVEEIVWQSPRVLYDDEDICVTVKGAVNTAISLRAYGENGELLGTVNDYIRADGDYHWSLNMPGSYEGFFYIGENNSQVRSTWGYVHDMPAISYTGNYAYSLYTSNPQPGFYPEEYEVDSDDLMFYFWSTAVDPSELMDHEVEVWYQGDSDEVKYSENFTNLNAYYYGMGSGTLNATSVGSRYIIMAQDLLSGEDYDGLVIDLANPPGLGTYGAYQPVVVEEGTTDEIGETVSSYWYVSNTGLTYFSTLLSCSECDPASYLAATLSVNAEGGAFDIYDTVQCQIVVDEVDGMSTGTVVNSGTSVAFVSEQTSFDFITPITHGDYYVVFTVSGSGMGINEVLNTPFTVIGGGSSGGETTGEEISNRIDTWLDSAGLDNEFGHWLLLIIGMALAVGIGIYVGKPVIAVPICAGILTLAIVESWVAPWIVILQAVFIAVAFAKWIAGKGGGND